MNTSLIDTTTSVAEARRIFQDRLMDGHTTVCWTCDREAKLRREVLYSGCLVVLAAMYHIGKCGDFVYPDQIREHVTKYRGMASLLTSDPARDTNRLRYFGLAEPMKKTSGEAKTLGGWRCVKDGSNFLRGNLVVPKIAWTYNKQVIKREGPLIDVHEAWGTKFDLDKFLAGTL